MVGERPEGASVPEEEKSGYGACGLSFESGFVVNESIVVAGYVTKYFSEGHSMSLTDSVTDDRTRTGQRGFTAGGIIGWV